MSMGGHLYTPTLTFLPSQERRGFYREVQKELAFREVTEGLLQGLLCRHLDIDRCPYTSFFSSRTVTYGLLAFIVSL